MTSEAGRGESRMSEEMIRKKRAARITEHSKRDKGKQEGMRD